MSTFAPLFVPDALRAAVAGEAWLDALLAAERALARAGAAAGIVPAERAAAIEAACVADGLDWEVLLADARAVGNPAEPLVRVLAARVGDPASAWVHLGATSQDIVDTAAMLVARDALELIDRELGRGVDACAGLAVRYRDTPMVARTLLQRAVPTTFGLRAAGWLAGVGEARERLAAVRSTGLAAQLGGAAGTLALLGDKGIEMTRLFAAELGLVEPVLPWHAERSRIAVLGGALDLAAGTVAKPALDVVLLAQSEVGEVREGGDGGGSSTMPHKRNPVAAIRARACARLVHGHVSVLTGPAEHELDRAAGAWHAEWDALGGALACAGGAAAALADSLASLEVDVDRMHANLLAAGPSVTTERLVALLAPTHGREGARTVVREAEVRASAAGTTLPDEVVAVETGLTLEAVRAALEPETYTGSAAVLVDRALARYGQAGR